MNTTYAIKARFYTRQAWMLMGKAREAKRNLRNVSDEWQLIIAQSNVRDNASLARQSMRVAVIYRQIEGRP